MTTDDRSKLRLLPAVDRVLGLPAAARLAAQHGRPVVKEWIREALAEMRRQAEQLSTDAAAIEQAVVERLLEFAARASSQRLRRVINGTGIVIHTNLGRAPLAPAAAQALLEAAECTNLEVDLESGQRGRRGAAVEKLCQEITGAEAALVVNNCAAATLLTLQTLAQGRRVVISRGQLIEIGGSFRLPDVFRQAGVELSEVGTTNRTRLEDYAAAIDGETAALLRVHPSNYRVTGFCESVSIAELVSLGRLQGLPVIDDVGSGCLHDLSRYGLPDEPVIADSIRAGADLVLFSGDKLLGGPQCGVIVGKKEIIGKLRANPLARALRIDKLTTAALQATLEIHRAGTAFQEIPVLRQLALPAEELRRRGENLLARLRAETKHAASFAIESVASAPGGGSLPEQTLASWALTIATANPDRAARALRLGEPAIFCRVQEGMVLIDLRTVLPSDDENLLSRLLQLSPE